MSRPMSATNNGYGSTPDLQGSYFGVTTKCVKYYIHKINMLVTCITFAFECIEVYDICHVFVK